MYLEEINPNECEGCPLCSESEEMQEAIYTVYSRPRGKVGRSLEDSEKG